MSKTALVLSGGGFKGAFQVGAINYLQNNWNSLFPDSDGNMKFDIVAGVSVGSLNGLLVASEKYDSLYKLWRDVASNGVEEIYTSDIIDTKPRNGIPNPELEMCIDWDTVKKLFPRTTKNILLRLFFNRKSFIKSFKDDFSSFKSVADNSPLKKKLIQFARIKNIRNCIYMCGFVSLNDGVYYSSKHTDFNTDLDFANGVLASTTMPIVWNPIESITINAGHKKHSVDGGIRNVSPLGDVINEICCNLSDEEYTIIIINCSAGDIIVEDYENKNIAQIALRSLNDIALCEIFNNDINNFIDKNYMLQQIYETCPEAKIYDYDFENKKQGKLLKHFNSIIIQPSSNTLGDPLVSNDMLYERRFNHGMLKAEQAVKEYNKNPNKIKFSIT
ncbi:MAG: patatin-like phospholipase family protein [Bacteroidales bacterium]|nr:patatin-like phospholipase family protein [Bacteroidales bacterium]